MKNREKLLQDFLSKSDWDQANRQSIASDASGRTYERLTLNSSNAILMNAPYSAGEDVKPFVAVTHMLKKLNLSAPIIYNKDIKNGFLLLEDLGDSLFSLLCEKSPKIEDEIYSSAINLLLHIHKNPAPENLLKYDINILIKESNLLTDWYLPNAIGNPLSETLIDEFQNILSKTFSKVPSNNPVLVMRDYHAENLIWLPKRSGINRVGLLDYQDALAGHPAYDLVSLLEDARRDTSSDLQKNMINKYISNSDLNNEEFLMAYNLLGAQRNIKIIGIFSRLSLRDKKSNYINLIPRVWNHLMNNLNHEACSDLKQWVNKNVPCPNHIVLQKLVPVI